VNDRHDREPKRNVLGKQGLVWRPAAGVDARPTHLNGAKHHETSEQRTGSWREVIPFSLAPTIFRKVLSIEELPMVFYEREAGR
jgi:hypothetical protein